MNAKEFAQSMDGCEYMKEGTTETWKEAERNGLVVVFGASDDLIEMRGAIEDEADCWDGGDVFLDKDGFLTNKCNEIECPYFVALLEAAPKITTLWDNGEYAWMYETDIPHETFTVFETKDSGVTVFEASDSDERKKYCRGIVFSIKDLRAKLDIL